MNSNERDYLNTCEHKVLAFLRELQTQHTRPTPSAKHIADNNRSAIAVSSVHKFFRVKKPTNNHWRNRPFKL